MPKKIIKNSRLAISRTQSIKKGKKEDEQQDSSLHDDADSDEISEENSEISDEYESQNGNGDQDSEEQSSISEIKPQNLAIRNMSFREKRGTKMNYLMNRKKDEEQDPFWKEQGQNYFGDLGDQDQEGQDYVQSSSGRDQFDSDFDQTESEHEQEEGKQQQALQEEERQRERRRRQQMMRKFQPLQLEGEKQKVLKSNEKNLRREQKKVVESGSRYIHQMFNQSELLGEAATTEYFNWLSLKKLISIQSERRDFLGKQHHIEGSKIIYRDRIQDGKRNVTYQCVGVSVDGIAQLSHIMEI